MNTPDWQKMLQASGAVFPAPQDAGRRPQTSWAPTALHFGNAADEFRRGREEVVIFDVNDRTQMELAGPDAVSFLHNLCTNDVQRLSPGEGCEAFFANVKGRVVGHVALFRGEESVWLETVPQQEEALLAHLERYHITEDLTLHSRTNDWAELFVSGPAAAEALSPLASAAEELSVGAHRLVEAPNAPAPVELRRVDWFACPGFLLRLARPQWPALWQWLTKTVKIPPAGWLAFEMLRIGSRYPLYGVDITADNLAQEVDRTAQTISFTKGCYLGQEPIARIDALGHVNRLLRGLQLQGGPAPAAGDIIRPAGEETEIGRVTSAVQLDETALPRALGYVRREQARTGCQVEIVTAGGPRPAVVFQQADD